MTTRHERIEWIRSWCEDTDKHDLPRLLVIGDSITDGTQIPLRKRLAGRCYVDCLTTSYALDNPLYAGLVKSFVTDCRYDIVQYNFGLHGAHITPRSFAPRVEKILSMIQNNAGAVYIANVTAVFTPDNERPDKAWAKRIDARNRIYRDTSDKLGIRLFDWYTPSFGMPRAYRTPDGVHYTDEGYVIFAERIDAFLTENGFLPGRPMNI